MIDDIEMLVTRGPSARAAARSSLLFNYKARSRVKNVNNDSSTTTNPTNNNNSSAKFLIGTHFNQHQSQQQHQQQNQVLARKWTCLVCLSKHVESVGVCSICGSSRPTTAATATTTGGGGGGSVSSVVVQLAKNRYAHLNQPTKSSLLKNHVFSTYLLNQLGYNNNNTKQQDSVKTISSSSSSSSQSTSPVLQQQQQTTTSSLPNPYLKRWTCRHCNFSNDSLKIVCLNCRWVKTCPNSSTDRTPVKSMSPSKVTSRTSMSDQTDETKRESKTTKQIVEEATQTDTATTSTPSPTRTADQDVSGIWEFFIFVLAERKLFF